MLISLNHFILVACLAATLVLVLLDYFRRQFRHRSLAYVLILAVVAIGGYFLTSSAPSKLAFGPTSASPLVALALMFLGILFGIAATYVFNLAGPFSWRDFARPLVVSPLILLPLIGSLQGANLEPVQLVCFVVLAFQNGFFWQQVLRDAKPTTS
jgi:formate hydrogenlyase subunit 3/multisubunit Na+/H+ antiporter MnhD subunit